MDFGISRSQGSGLMSSRCAGVPDFDLRGWEPLVSEKFSKRVKSYCDLVKLLVSAAQLRVKYSLSLCDAGQVTLPLGLWFSLCKMRMIIVSASSSQMK